MTVTPLGRDQDCSLKNREPDGPAPWFLDPGGWSKASAVGLYFIFPGICTLSLDSLLLLEQPYAMQKGFSVPGFMLKSLVCLDKREVQASQGYQPNMAYQAAIRLDTSHCIKAGQGNTVG
ncbi:hypothetical protein STEG23_028725, partial [Scotinomys teguina]